jgi:hypothetical protein
LPFEDFKFAVTGPGIDEDSAVRIAASAAVSLGMSSLPFGKTPPIAISMSKACRKRGGKGLELSGEEIFRHVSLPLNKALAHYLRITRPKSQQMYFDIRAVFPLVVLRAPMIGVRMMDGAVNMEANPWIRFVRTEPGADPKWGRFSDLTSFDVVHIDYLAEYTKQALAAAQEIITRVKKIAMIVITGYGVWPSIGKIDGPNIYNVLEPYLTDDEFQAWVRQRFIEVHPSNDATDKTVIDATAAPS